MTDEVLRPGQNARLQLVRQEEVRILLSVTGAAPLRLLGVLLDEAGRAVTQAPLLTWRQNDRDVKISLSQGETIAAQFNTAALQSPVQAIMFIAAPYGREAFLDNEKLFTAIAPGGMDPMVIDTRADGAGQQAIALCEFYRHPEQGVKLRALSEFRGQPLTSLLEQLGVANNILTDQMLYPLPHGRKSDSARASLNDLVQQDERPPLPPEPEKPPTATIHQFPKSPQQPQQDAPQRAAIQLNEPDREHRCAASNAEFGPIRMQFRWHQPISTQSRVKMDIGCLWELQNGKKGQLQAFANQRGSAAGEPYVALSEDIQQRGATLESNIAINGNEWKHIKRILCYAAIGEGPVQWNPLDARVQLQIPDQDIITAHLHSTSKPAPIAALFMLENRSNDMRVTMPGGYYASYHALDHEFGFHLRSEQHENKPETSQQQKLSWQPRQRGLWEQIFGLDSYQEVEALMRACLAAAAMVLISDGRVNLSERKNIIQVIMRLPIGKYFAHYEVRQSFENILRDFKAQRKASDQLAKQILRPFRKTSDAKLIVMAMRRAAMADGNISIQEERMVERITRFLGGDKDI